MTSVDLTGFVLGSQCRIRLNDVWCECDSQGQLSASSVKHLPLGQIQSLLSNWAMKALFSNYLYCFSVGSVLIVSISC